jgi:hypothetical protein
MPAGRRNTNLRLIAGPSPLDKPRKPPQSQRCKVAPSKPAEIAEMDSEAKRASSRIDEVEKYRTAAYLRLGVILIALRAFFPTGWEAHLKDLGIEETRWKRAMCLASHFKSEDECRDLPLTEALEQAGWGKRQKQNRQIARKPRAGSPGAESNGHTKGGAHDPVRPVRRANKPTAEAVDVEPDDVVDDAADDQERIITRETEPPTHVKKFAFMDAVMDYAEDVGWAKARELFDELEKNGTPFEEV